MAKPDGEARPARGEGRRALLEAAIRVVGRGGLRGLTYRAVALEAGVTHGLVAHHFGSRNALIEEAMEYAVLASIDEATMSPDAGQGRDFVANLGQLVAADEDLQAFQYELVLEARRHGGDWLAWARDAYRRYFDATARELEQFGLAEDEELARIVFAALDGLTLQQLVFSSPEVTASAVQRLQRLLSELGARG